MALSLGSPEFRIIHDNQTPLVADEAGENSETTLLTPAQIEARKRYEQLQAQLRIGDQQLVEVLTQLNQPIRSI